jgi:hypothetical protein
VAQKRQKPGKDVSYSFYAFSEILTPATATDFISDIAKKSEEFWSFISGCMLF